MENVKIDDTTLRDGMQMPGIRSPSPQERLEIAHYLDDIGIDRIELFGMFYDVDRKTAQMILNAGLKSQIGIWVRAVKDDIDEALRLDGVKGVGISHPISDIHLKYKLNISREQAYNRIHDAVQYCKDHGLIVFYHGEDSTRADWEYEKTIIKMLTELKADVYRVCDTVGVGIGAHKSTVIPINKSIPDKISEIVKNFKIEIEFHGHDDLGGAVTNTMIALQNGAKWASTTMLGMGERAGNAETEKVIMNLNYHYDNKKYDISLLTKTCQVIHEAMDIRIPSNKAIVGENVFTHQSGIHSAGVIKNPETYEPFDPDIVGNVRRLLVGPLGGKHVILFKLEQVLEKEGITEKVDPNDGRVKALIDYIRENLFGSGIRHSPLTDVEFEQLVRMFALK
ncbi:MAG: isopropylmalate synthase [Candidatus Helarchaeota archaeon]|nr:isopropylmalate synthase [Candidatus Helarchaeota archaeon]